MPNSVITAKENAYPRGSTFDQKTGTKRGTIALAAGNYQTGGLPLVLPPNNFSNPQPIDVTLRSLGNTGFVYQWVNVNLWPTSGTVVAGQSIQDPNGNMQTVTTGGTTGSTQPTWAKPSAATPNPTTTDNTAVWTCEGPSNGLIKILTGAAAQSALTEQTGAAATPAAVVADTIEYVATYQRG